MEDSNSQKNFELKDNMVENQYEVMTVFDWFITTLVLVIPIVGLIMLFVWGFGSDNKPSRANYCKFFLIINAIGIVLAVVVAIVGTSFIVAIFHRYDPDEAMMENWYRYQFLKEQFASEEEPIEFVSPPPATLSPTVHTPVPTLVPTPQPTPEQAYLEYVVQSGDTAAKISAAFYNGQNRVAEIVEFNENLTDPNSLRVGQIIKLPILDGYTSGVSTPKPTPEQVYLEYTIQSGDTLSKISATFYNGQNRVAEIVAYNENLVDTSSISVGMVIKLPILEGIDIDGN